MENLLEQQKKEVDTFFEQLDTVEIEKMVNILHQLKTKNKSIYFTGVGKSLNIAKHTSDILRSIGLSAHVLHPTESLHGDLGVLNKGDLVIFYSKSGKTKELEELSFYLKKMKIDMIGVFCKISDSLLYRAMNQVIILPCGQELDNGFDLVPTTSVVGYIVFCNLLTAGLLKTMDLGLEEYGVHHPSGTIGQKVWLLVKDVMYSLDDVCCVNSNSSLIEVMKKMISCRTGYCLVIDNDQLMGIISDGDIRRYVIDHHQDLNINVKKLMIVNPITVQENLKVSEVIEKINKNKSLSIGLPVLDQNKEKIVGFLDSKLLLKYHHLL